MSNSPYNAYNPAESDTAGRLRAIGVLPSYHAPIAPPATVATAPAPPVDGGGPSWSEFKAENNYEGSDYVRKLQLWHFYRHAIIADIAQANGDDPNAVRAYFDGKYAGDRPTQPISGSVAGTEAPVAVTAHTQQKVGAQYTVGTESYRDQSQSMGDWGLYFVALVFVVFGVATLVAFYIDKIKRATGWKGKAIGAALWSFAFLGAGMAVKLREVLLSGEFFGAPATSSELAGGVIGVISGIPAVVVGAFFERGKVNKYSRFRVGVMWSAAIVGFVFVVAATLYQVFGLA